MEQVSPEKELNPWLSIWFSPRATFRQLLVASHPGPLLLLVGLGSSYHALRRVLETSDAKTLHEILLWLIAGTMGAAIGWIVLTLGARIQLRAIKFMGGTCPREKLQIVIAWSYLPFAVGFLLTSLQLFVMGKAALNANVEVLLAGEMTPGVRSWLFSEFADMVFYSWWWIIYLKGVSEVTGFSFWRSFSAWSLGLLLWGLLCLVLILIVGTIFFATGHSISPEMVMKILLS